MNFDINVGKFLEILEKAVVAATKEVDNEFDYFNKITVNALPDKLILTAHGGTLVFVANVSDKVGYKCQEQGFTTVKSDDFYKAIKSCPESLTANVKKNNNEIIISFIASEQLGKEEQSIPVTVAKTFADGDDELEIACPKFASEFTKKMTIDRDVFVNSLKEIMWATGYEESKPYYQCISLQKNEDRIRFITGTGGRFAVKDVKGSVVDENSCDEIILPKKHVSNIVKILDKDDTTDIVIGYSDSNANNGEQIDILTDSFKMIVLGLDPNNKEYKANVDNVLNKEHSYRFTCDLENLKLAISGVEATNSEEMKKSHELHNAKIKALLDKKCLNVVTEANLKANRKVPFSESISEGYNNEEYCVSSTYLTEVVKCFKSGICNIYFDDEKAPVIFDIPEKVNSSKDIKEKFWIFFAQSISG